MQLLNTIGTKYDEFEVRDGRITPEQARERRGDRIYANVRRVERMGLLDPGLISMVSEQALRVNPDERLMNQAQDFHNAQLDAQDRIAEQAKDQRDETNKLLLLAVQTLQEQLSHMKQAGNQVGGFASGGFVHRFSEGGRVLGVEIV